MSDIRSTADASAGCGQQRIRSVSVVGSGQMGRAIALACARAGFSVCMADADVRLAVAAVGELTRRCREMEPFDGPHLHRTSPQTATSVAIASTVEDAADVDLVIEAITENLDAKRALLSQLGPRLRRDTIVASNTSSLRIADVASDLPTPGNLCGLHFCHPVAERALVEVVRSHQTRDHVIAAAREFVVRLGKNPIVVTDHPGFVLNRVLVPYLTEALELLLEGVSLDSLDSAACDFGMPQGPLRQLDEFGLDVALAVGGNLLRAYPDRAIPSELLIAMYKSGRRGRKSGGGFYADLADGRPAQLHEITRTILARRMRPPGPIPVDNIPARLFLPMLLEAVRVLEDGVVDAPLDRPETIDTILRDGLGMTAQYQGLFVWAAKQGRSALQQMLAQLQPLGKRFEPPRGLYDILTRVDQAPAVRSAS